jgi:hypothetical protein
MFDDTVRRIVFSALLFDNLQSQWFLSPPVSSSRVLSQNGSWGSTFLRMTSLMADFGHLNCLIWSLLTWPFTWFFPPPSPPSPVPSSRDSLQPPSAGSHSSARGHAPDLSTRCGRRAVHEPFKIRRL